MSAMTASMFYVNKITRPFNVPMLAFEVAFIEINKLGDDLTEERLISIYSDVLVSQCKVEVSQQNLDHLVNVISTSSTIEDSVKASAKSSQKGGFTSQFYKYFLDVPIDQMLLQICGYDMQKAEYLYCVADREDTLKVVEAYTTRLQQDHMVMLESCVCGFGGDMKSSDSDHAKEYNVSDNIEEAKQAFKNLF